MYKNLIEYQYQYFSKLYQQVDLDFGYITQSDDLEYINSNSIIVTEVRDDVLTSVCSLLATNIHTTKIQMPAHLIEFGDEEDSLYLIKYQAQDFDVNADVEFVAVTASNFSEYIELSNQLQIQEYGKLYKVEANNNYLEQNDYQMFMIKYKNQFIGEFTYINELKAVEALIVLKAYQRQGIGRVTLELVAKSMGELYLSADNSSIEFYRAIGAEVIDQYDVTNIYGNSRTLLTYLILCI